MVGDLDACTFEGLEDPAFRVVGTAIVLRLAAVQRHAEQPHASRREPFSLVFTGPPKPILPQATWPLEHASLGGMDVFLVPIGPGPEGPMRYEAVFN